MAESLKKSAKKAWNAVFGLKPEPRGQKYYVYAWNEPPRERRRGALHDYQEGPFSSEGQAKAVRDRLRSTHYSVTLSTVKPKGWM